MHYNFQAFFRVQNCLLAAQQRFESMKLGFCFTTLVEHVSHRGLLPPACLAYKPSFTLPKERVPRYSRRMVSEQLGALETVIACCYAIKLPLPKATNALLSEVNVALARFDSLAVRQATAKDKRHAAQRKGGLARHEPAQLAVNHAVTTAREMQPTSGWKDEAQAARAIEPRMIEFILAHRLSLVTGDNLRRTLRRWLRAGNFNGPGPV